MGTWGKPKTSKRQQSRSCHCSVIFFVIFLCSYHFLKKKTKCLKNTMASKKSKACWLVVSVASVSFYPDIHLTLSRFGCRPSPYRQLEKNLCILVPWIVSEKLLPKKAQKDFTKEWVLLWLEQHQSLP